MKITEHGFNKFIAAGQWSSSWFIAAAFLLVLLGVKVPDWLSNAFLFVVGISAPLFLVVGMFQCWKLQDGRKWLAIPASLFLIFSGVLLFTSVVERDHQEKVVATLEIVHQSAAWKVAQAEFDSAMAAYTVLASRTFPANYPTWFSDNEEKKAVQWGKVEEKAKSLKALEPAVSNETKTAFDLFGTEASWIVQSVFLALYAVVNEAIALALSYRRKDTAPKLVETAQTRARPFTVDDYIREALRLGKDGALAGYRQVAEETGQSTYRCRELFGEALQSGRIKKKPGERGAREEDQAIN